MLYELRHTTTYRYAAPVDLGHRLLRLTPRELPTQRVLGAEILVDPLPRTRTSHTDVFGNTVTHLTHDGAHSAICVTALSRVVVEPAPGMPPESQVDWQAVRDALPTDRSPRARQAYGFTFDSPRAGGSDALADYAAGCFPAGQTVHGGARALCAQVHRDFRFDPAATDVTTPVAQVFAQRSGVCQDFAHLMTACLRALRLPARYVSGYLRTEPPPGRPRLVGADASHAWVSVWSPDAGWLDLDPTNNITGGPDHITVAWGRDYDDVTPIRGTLLGGGAQSLEVAVDVLPVVEAQAAGW